MKNLRNVYASLVPLLDKDRLISGHLNSCRFLPAEFTLHHFLCLELLRAALSLHY